MSNTQVIQQREAVVVSGTVKYKITTSCVERGSLQDTNIFLLNIITPDDPKDDTFSRVVEIADVDTYSTVRDTAIENSDAFWRSSTATLYYADIETANAAWKELSSRINALVENYDKFVDEFATDGDGELIVYPTLDESAKQQLKDDYAAANTALTEAQTALAAHSCDSIEADIADTETQLAQAQGDLALYSTIQASLTSAVGTYTMVYATLFANNATVRSLNTTSAAEDAEKDTIEGYLTANDSYLNQFNVQNTALNALVIGSVTTAVTTLQARVIDLTQDKNNLFVDLNNCRTEEATLQAAVASAQATRDAALAAVIAVCPDFVP